jgi:hypothetical protein
MGLKSRGLPALKARLAELVPQLFEAYTDYGRRNDMETDEIEEVLGPPCDPADIDALEAELGVALPPSYRAFLSLYSHWLGVPGCGGADLLGPGEHRSEHVKRTLAWKSTMFDEFESTNPIEQGAVPLAIGDDRNMILFEGEPRDDGEISIVHYYLTEAETRYADLVEMFTALVEQYRED